ncbi:TRAF-interacting protein with FHA domain-containing protein A [Tupaia chinensis]|uniref:TRAF-interacting protein with FHA domain-containing protein A n=1 Tax=Tupaia chinensis TaxID=246437 RepID=L8YBB3_TUPCH|nr:TRAF-interacting protein with FHA domain-containing protein A [Tupaia chinensis]ELV13713.1 TRAF-interacting protein with FHA domain-containing protein A [Tupaia chinensis]
MTNGARSLQAALWAHTMSHFEDADTEETVTCLKVTVYHPSQLQSGVFQSIRFYSREKLPSSEVVRFGRNPGVCQYTFQDRQASRVQFCLQLFKKPDSSVLSFEIKNMSKRSRLLVGGRELGYLNKADLPHRCLVRFGQYQLLMEQEDGESLEFFETQFTLSPSSLLQENNGFPQSPIPEYGGYSPCSTHGTSPTEMDENES